MNLRKLKISNGDLLSLRHQVFLYASKFYIATVLDDRHLLIDSKIYKVRFEAFKSSHSIKLYDFHFQSGVATSKLCDRQQRQCAVVRYRSSKLLT